MRVSTKLQSLAWALQRRLGRAIPYGVQRRVYRWLFPADAPRPPFLLIDVVGNCNLRCPSCPVGNMARTNPTGIMPVDLFREIIGKARAEYGPSGVALYNWTEPFLHPKLGELIEVVKSADLYCIVSTNLHIVKNVEEVLRAAPDDLRISLSGFSQGTYQQTHTAGDIERVKENMRLLSRVRDEVGNRRTRIHVYYHKYRHNLREIPDMQGLARELGFHWFEGWAYYMPLERVLELAEDTLPKEQAAFVERQFALPIERALKEASAYQDSRCTLLEDQITIDVRGNVVLCCAVYEQEKNRLGNFLTSSREEILSAKTDHPTCERCTRHGAHAYFAFYDNPGLAKRYDELARDHLRDVGEA